MVPGAQLPSSGHSGPNQQPNNQGDSRTPSSDGNWIQKADFQLLFENNHLGLATTDPKFHFVQVNCAFEKMVGYSREELLSGMHLGQLSPDNAAVSESKHLIEKLYSRELESFEVEKVYQRKDGSLIEAITSVTATYLEDGTLAGCTAIVIDITQRRQMERERQALLEQMQAAQEELVRSEKLASLGALVAGIAHEVNTPIGNSLTIASSLQERSQKVMDSLAEPDFDLETLGPMIGKLNKGAHLIVHNLRRAANLISNFKKVAVDRASGVKRDFLLTDVLDEVLATVKHIIGSRVLFHIDVPPEIQLTSFPGDLGRVFSNLIENAARHAFPQGREGQIWIKAQLSTEDSGHVEICVYDDGVGVSPEIVEKVFDPFFTTKLGTGGSGLGLYITYGVVHNVLLGRCSFSSEEGTGSQFKMVIPLVVDDPTE